MKRLRIPFAILMAIIMTLSFLPSVLAEQAAPAEDPFTITGQDAAPAEDPPATTDPDPAPVEDPPATTDPDTAPVEDPSASDPDAAQAGPDGNGGPPNSFERKVVLRAYNSEDGPEEDDITFTKNSGATQRDETTLEYKLWNDYKTFYFENASTPTSTTHDFVGWDLYGNESSKLYGTKYGQNRSYTFYSNSGTKYFYATWKLKPLKIKITYKPSDGSEEDTKITGIPNDTITLTEANKKFNLPTTNPEHAGGKTFAGWKRSWSSDPAYAVDATEATGPSKTGDYTLIATWKHDPEQWVDIIYSKGDVTAAKLPEDGLVLISAGTFTLPANEPTTTDNKDFVGWDAAWTTGATEEWKKDTLVNFTAKDVKKYKQLELIAIWSNTPAPTDIKITYDDGVEDKAISDTIRDIPTIAIQSTLGGTFKIPETVPKRPGHTFSGWAPDWLTDITYKAGSTNNAAPTSSSTSYKLIAKWARDSSMYEVKYASGAPSGETVEGIPAVPVYVKNDTSYKINESNPSRSGYTFKGWLCSTNGGTYFKDKEVPFQDNKGYTLTAQWNKSSTSGPTEPTYYPDYDDEYTIDANCSSGGYIYHEGRRTVDRGDDLTITWAPRSGYSIDAVYIDGRLNNNYDGSYTFSNITSDHSIYVDYVRGSGSSWDDDDHSPQTEDTSMPMWLLLCIGAAAATLIVAANKRAKA